MRKKLKEARQRAGMTQKQVAECLGISEIRYRQMGSGKRIGAIKRRVFMDACLTVIVIGFVWQILEMIFYGKVQPRIVDDVVWMILFRYIYLAKKRKEELYRIKEEPFMIPCPPRMGDKKDVPWL